MYRTHQLDQLSAAYSDDPDDGELEDMLDDDEDATGIRFLSDDSLRRLAILARIGHLYWTLDKVPPR